MKQPSLQDDQRVKGAMLKHGSHVSRKDGMCAMEFAAYLANEPHTALPMCVHSDLADVITTLNDGGWWRDDLHRTTEMMPLVLASIGTRRLRLNTATALRMYDKSSARRRRVYDKSTATVRKIFIASLIASLVAECNLAKAEAVQS